MRQLGAYDDDVVVVMKGVQLVMSVSPVAAEA
jgi:hypothetical protein